MSSNPNPLEPWRPVGRTPSPHPSIRLPSPTSSWGPEPPRPSEPAQVLRMDQLLLVVLLLNLVALGLIAFKKLPFSQAPQILSVLLLVALGLGAGITWARNRHWVIRLTLVAAGIGLAVAAWWFVPTTGGLSLWMAEQEAGRCLAELENLPIGDADAYQKNLDAREETVAQFPGFQTRSH